MGLLSANYSLYANMQNVYPELSNEMPRQTSQKMNHTCFKEHVTFLAAPISLQFMDMADSFGRISLYSQNMGDKCHLKTEHFIRYLSVTSSNAHFYIANRVSPSRKISSHQSDAICDGRAMLKARGSLGFHIIFLYPFKVEERGLERWGWEATNEACWLQREVRKNST